jgi:hypothetical protein
MLLEYILALAFGAGGVYFLIKQSRKDVNGLGRKVSREMTRSAVRHQNVTLALMLLASEEQKQKIAELLKESHQEKEL